MNDICGLACDRPAAPPGWPAGKEPLDVAIPTVVPDRSLQPAAQLNRDSEWLDFRNLTVGRSTGRDHQAPFLRLEGRWLWKAGFPVGSKVLVAVAERRLLIEPESPLMELCLDASPKPVVPKQRLGALCGNCGIRAKHHRPVRSYCSYIRSRPILTQEGESEVVRVKAGALGKIGPPSLGTTRPGRFHNCA